MVSIADHTKSGGLSIDPTVVVITVALAIAFYMHQNEMESERRKANAIEDLRSEMSELNRYLATQAEDDTSETED